MLHYSIVIVLWFTVIGEFFLILALARQVGLILLRLGDSGAGAMGTPSGLNIGEKIPPISTQDFFSKPLVFPSSGNNKDLLLIFTSTSCGNCAQLIPSLVTISKAEAKETKLVVVSQGEEWSTHRNYAQLLAKAKISYVISSELYTSFNIYNLPYAILISKGGYVISKGLVNHLEHLESLLNSRDEPLKIAEREFGHLVADRRGERKVAG